VGSLGRSVPGHSAPHTRPLIIVPNSVPIMVGSLGSSVPGHSAPHNRPLIIVPNSATQNENSSSTVYLAFRVTMKIFFFDLSPKVIFVFARKSIAKIYHKNKNCREIIVIFRHRVIFS
jgi:hypothetical protein